MNTVAHHRRVPSDPFEFDEPMGFDMDFDCKLEVQDQQLCDSSTYAPFGAEAEQDEHVNWGEVESWLSSSCQATPETFRMEEEGAEFEAAPQEWGDFSAMQAPCTMYDDCSSLMSPTTMMFGFESAAIEPVSLDTLPKTWSQDSETDASSEWSAPESAVWSGSEAEEYQLEEEEEEVFGVPMPSGAVISPRPEAGAEADKTSVASLASLLDKPLPAQVALAMLTSSSFNPGARPPNFAEGEAQWLFKESSGERAAPARGKQSKDEVRADRWHNSGGLRGSRDMPIKGSADTTPVVRRRYGSIVCGKKIKYRYHEYSLVFVFEDAEEPDGFRVEEDRSTAVFHVMPKRTGKGRPSKAEADEPLRLWQQHPYGRTLVSC